MSNEQRFLIDCIVDDVSRYLIEDRGLSITEALDIVYNSQFFEKLTDLETGLYYQGAPYNYEYLKHELKFGKEA